MMNSLITSMGSRGTPVATAGSRRPFHAIRSRLAPRRRRRGEGRTPLPPTARRRYLCAGLTLVNRATPELVSDEQSSETTATRGNPSALLVVFGLLASIVA